LGRKMKIKSIKIIDSLLRSKHKSQFEYTSVVSYTRNYMGLLTALFSTCDAITTITNR